MMNERNNLAAAKPQKLVEVKPVKKRGLFSAS